MTDNKKKTQLIHKADKIVSEMVERKNESIKRDREDLLKKINESIRGSSIKFENCSSENLQDLYFL